MAAERCYLKKETGKEGDSVTRVVARKNNKLDTATNECESNFHDHPS